MAKCAACGRFISTKGGATCSNFTCPNRYHVACLSLPESTQIRIDWQCPDCKKKMPKSDNSATPVKELNSGVPVTPGPAAALPNSALTRSPVAQVESDNSAAPVKELCSGVPVNPGPVAALPHGALTRSPVAQVEKVQVQAGRDCTVGEPSPESQLTLREEIRLFRSELREVRDEIREVRDGMREFRRDMADLHLSLGACTGRVDSLEARIEALEAQSVTPGDDKAGRLEFTIKRLQLEINDRDQELLSSDLEIANIPDIHGENVMHTVGLVAAKLGVTLEERDIVFAQRVGPKVEREPLPGDASNGSPLSRNSQGGGTSPAGGADLLVGPVARGRRIVVRLSRRALRDELLQSARVRRGASTADLGLPGPPRRFYLNERLTKINKQLFYRVREAGSRLGWRYTWTKFGRILAKQGDGKQTHCIRTEEDLVRVFGCIVSADRMV